MDVFLLELELKEHSILFEDIKRRDVINKFILSVYQLLEWS